ncbi:Crp/Fnr family transcriptional regulator [Amycolatopsis sp. 195334CR]|uniref:Crp/Fnr family transcriptional regulator n=1 Tax=Amycolatopsis sp. 195334CR TaxID=2814588 RepID=UPI001F5E182C|nr:Crp/Fnr family transcriptional regulator [Amycolatopsis sp. 195334CR]
MTDKFHQHDIGEQRRLEETVLHLHSLIERLAAHNDRLWHDTPEMKALVVLRNKIAYRGADQSTPAELRAAVERMTDFLQLLERSSLGTPASHRIRRLTSARDVAAILTRAGRPPGEPATADQLTAPSQARRAAEDPRSFTAETGERGAPNGDAATMPDQEALLAHLTDADREYLLARGTRRPFRADEVVIEEGGAPSDHVHVLVSGRVRISSIGEDGHEVLIGLRGPGEMLDDPAATTGHPRTASVRAIEPCTVLQLTGAEFAEALRTRPAIAIAIAKTVAARLRAAQSARIGYAGRRVAMCLTQLAEKHGRTVPDGVIIEAARLQTEIAAQAGVAQRTVARTLRTWRTQGIVATSRRRILVRSMDELRALARSEPNAGATR